MPLFDRDLLIVSDECVRDLGADWPKLTWVLDMRKEDNLVPISTLPLPPVRSRFFDGSSAVKNRLCPVRWLRASAMRIESRCSASIVG